MTRVAAESHRLGLIPDRAALPEFYFSTWGLRHRRMAEIGQAAGVGKAVHLRGMVRGVIRKEQVINLLYKDWVIQSSCAF